MIKVIFTNEYFEVVKISGKEVTEHAESKDRFNAKGCF